VKAGAAVLFLSDAVLAEVREVPLRPELTRRYRHLTPERVAAFVADVQASAVHVGIPSKAFPLPRDPDDEPFIDLAVAVGAQYLVTWNARHLTYLMTEDAAEAKEFRQRFPTLRILSPVDFLREIAAPSARS
jgi:predicted nucleic acid-binding protein